LQPQHRSSRFLAACRTISGPGASAGEASLPHGRENSEDGEDKKRPTYTPQPFELSERGQRVPDRPVLLAVLLQGLDDLRIAQVAVEVPNMRED
jgi:hypothetical protein